MPNRNAKRSRVAPDRREKLRERAERRDRDADRTEPDVNRDRS